MSGSGGRSHGNLKSTSTPCDRLAFEAAIMSPDPEVVRSLHKGDILLLALRQQKPGGTIVVLKDNLVAGSIIEHVTELVRCIQAGHSFEAKVLSISGGDVRVQVRPTQ